MTEPSARPCGAADLGTLADLYEVALGEIASRRGASLLLPVVGVPRPFTSSLAVLLEDPDTGVYLGELASRPVGFAIVTVRPVDSVLPGIATSTAATVAAVYVAGPHRRAGVGRSLVEACQAFAHERGVTPLHALTAAGDLSTRSLYETLGFRGEVVVMSRRPDADRSP